MLGIVVRPVDKVAGNQNGVETVRVVLQRLSLELLEGGMELLRRGLAAVDVHVADNGKGRNDAAIIEEFSCLTGKQENCQYPSYHKLLPSVVF